MAEQMRELLHEAAPRPSREPDFERMWARGRRQRRMMQAAGVTGALVLLVVAGMGYSQLASPGQGDIEVVDEPEDQEPLRGRGQDFGQAETPDGVPFVGRIRVSAAPSNADGDATPERGEVCVGLRLGGDDERLLTAESCGSLERHLETDRMLWTHSRNRALAGVAAWTPLEVDHAAWELGEEELPVEVLAAPGLPGSVFVIAVDEAPEHDTTIVLYDAEGEEVDQLTLEVDGSLDDQDASDPEGDGPPVSDRWMTRDDMDITQEELGEGTWIAGYFYPSDADLAAPEVADVLEPRWLQISDDVLELDQQEQLSAALDALAGPPPTHMADAWRDPGLKLGLRSVETDGSELILDFDTLRAPANGTSHGDAMRAQFEAVARHYYPDASDICVLEDGQPTSWLHDMQSCSSRQ
ncbi:MAG: hypothetical protein ACLFRD_02340 [Nitriliruptoraceae bacterium]